MGSLIKISIPVFIIALFIGLNAILKTPTNQTNRQDVIKKGALLDLLGFSHFAKVPQKRQAYKRLESAKDNPDSIYCKRYWQTLVELDLNDFGKENDNWISINALPIKINEIDRFFENLFEVRDVNNCVVPKDHYLGRFHKEMFEACQSALSISKLETRPNIYQGIKIYKDSGFYDCFTKVMIYRFYITEYSFGKVPEWQISDLSVLVNRFFAIGFTQNPAYSSKMAAIADRIVELEPYSKSAAINAVKAHYVDLLLNLSTSERDEKDLAFERSLQKYATMGLETIREEDQYYEMRMNQARLRGDFGEILRLAEELFENTDRYEIGLYHLAWASYLMGAEDKGRSVLMEGLRQDPRSSRLFSSLIRLRNPDQAVRDSDIFWDWGRSFSFSVKVPQIEYGFGLSFNLAPYTVHPASTEEEHRVMYAIMAFLRENKITGGPLSREQFSDLVSRLEIN